MTREEAIKKLVNARYADEFQGDEELTTAHLMAIQALSQEQCDDVVSREAVDKYIVELLSGYLYNEERERLEKLSAYLWELPSVNPQPCDDAISRHKAIVMITAYEGKSAQIEALEQLPSVTPKPIECDDAISINAVDRFGVLNEIYEWTISGEYEQPRGTDILIKRINNMPTVTQESEYFIDGVHAMGYREGYKDAQKQKSGKWIDYSDEGYVECPFCGHATNCEDDIDELHYCFYCGAKMESEDKE